MEAQKYLAEFFGTALFIYVILVTGNAIAIGATLALVILLTAPISGGYVNPAVVFAQAYKGALPVKEILPYCLAEILGGIVAYQISTVVPL
jgi:glycerol uptake facilitator-like aquaporin